jgi:hypothetical protein
MRWGVHEAQFLPEIAAALQKASVARRRLIELALAPAFGAAPPAALTVLCEILLDFPAWQRLVVEQGFSQAEAETVLAETLVALARQHNAAARAIPTRCRRKPRTGRKLA